MPDSKVGIYEAKTHFTALISRAEKGEVVTITRHGKAVARIVPPIDQEDLSSDPDRQRLLQEFRNFRRKRSLGEITVRELIDEGRR